MGLAIKRYILVSVLLVMSTVINVNGKFSDCGSSIGEFTFVNVSSCSNKTPFCLLERGTTANLSIGIHTKDSIDDINVVVHGIIGGIPIPFKVPEPNGCHNSGILCPLPQDYNVTYTASLPILKTYPKLALTIKWELLNENKKNIICVSIPARIV